VENSDVSHQSANSEVSRQS